MSNADACQTPMSDHIAQFWELLATEHVRILIDIRRDHDEGPPHWDSASFPNDVAKALVAARAGDPAQPSRVPDEMKPIYVKRWRTLVMVSAKYADEIRDALARDYLSQEQLKELKVPSRASSIPSTDQLCPRCGRSIDGPTHAAYCAIPPASREGAAK